jgi:hypothetical protein
LTPSKPEDTNFALPQRTVGNKRKIGLIEANVSKHLKQASDALTTLTNKSQSQKLQDQPALYGQLLATKLRRLKPRNKIILQNKIDNLVFEAELSEIDSANARFVGRSLVPNFIAINSNSPAQYSSPSSSQFSSSSTYVPSPGPSPNSGANDNLNMSSQSTDVLF